MGVGQRAPKPAAEGAAVYRGQRYSRHQPERARNPAREIVIEDLGDEGVELIAILAHLSINRGDLTAAVDRIKRLPGVRYATWEIRATG